MYVNQGTVSMSAAFIILSFINQFKLCTGGTIGCCEFARVKHRPHGKCYCGGAACNPQCSFGAIVAKEAQFHSSGPHGWTLSVTEPVEPHCRQTKMH